MDERLHQRLTDLLARVCRQSRQCEPAARRVLAMYQEPIRHYHNLRHISHCLQEFDSVRENSAHPDALETAIWFHDVIYDPARNDNEQQSADLARRVLTECGADQAFAAEVAELIMVTLHDRPPCTTDGKLLADIDLSGLGQDPAGFDRDGDAIREEYRHVPDPQFGAGRASLLRRFLDRPHVYYTAVFRDRYEAAARSNLQRTLRRLEEPR